MYQVGQLRYPEDDDPTFDDYLDALRDARKKCVYDEVWAVWEVYDNGNSDIRALFFDGEEFTRV